MAPTKKQKSQAKSDAPIEQQPDSISTVPLDPPMQQQQQQGNDDNSAKPRPLDTARAQASSSSSRPGSWYNGGSWRSKASPVAQIAKESISVAKGATSESSEEVTKRPSQSVSKSMRGSRKSIPLVAEATRVHATSDVGDKSRPRFPSGEKAPAGGANGEEKKEEVKGADVVVEDAPLPPEPEAEDAKSVKSVETKVQPSAWFGWWSRPDGYGSDGEKAKGNKRRKLATDEASSTPLPGSPEAQLEDTAPKDSAAAPVPKVPAEVDQAKSAAQWEGVQPEMATVNTTARSWFGLWSSAQNEQAVAEASATEQPPEQEEPAPLPPVAATDPAVPEVVVQPADQPKTDGKKDSSEPPRSSGWAFWSSDRPKDDGATPNGTQKEVGELAVADTPSQSHPEAAQFNKQSDEQQQTDTTIKRASSLLRPKRGRLDKVKHAPSESSPSTPAESRSQTPSISQAPTPVDTPTPEDSNAPTPVKRGRAAQTRPNLILPSFRDLYPTAPNPGYLERLSSLLASALRLPGTDAPLPPQHVYLSPTAPKIKKAIAIGVHGFFPAPLIQKVLGQPTGTSIRFANYAAASIKTWCQDHQPDTKDIEIEKVALEGEGTITDRVTTLWKLLLNWLPKLRQADFILLAAHSQGVPVAFMLLAKLIQLGCLSPHVRLGVCAMAGINLGPFLEYKSRLFGGSALELFEFCDAGSKVSKSYFEALDICLRHGVRVTFIGSLDDQLVSMESSLYAPLSHPYVSRAVFIDGRVHAPNFLTHLVVFALKLRNLGISDHGLLRELSAPLAGSLVGGEGHSRVYDDPAVYALAIDFALHSTDVLPDNPPSSPATATASLLATNKDLAHATAAARRASLSGYPPNTTSANQIRRGSVTASTQLPGIAPIIAHYEPPQIGVSANPFYLPWAVRGMLEEEAVKRDERLMGEVRELVREFEEWRPISKVLKDVRWRLEGVRSMV